MPVTGLVKAACLLLKVVQSVEVRQPLLEAEALGQLMVKRLVLEVEILKLLPVVPVAMLGTTLAAAVIKPLPLTVNCAHWPELLPNVPTLELTVAKVVVMAVAPEPVTSPDKVIVWLPVK